MEPAQLLFASDVQEELDEPHPVGDEHPLELIDLFVSPAPFVLGGEALDPLDQHAAVPGTIKRDDLTVLRQPLPEALQIVQRLLVIAGRGDCVYLEASRIERPAEPPHHAALASRVPALKHHSGTVRRSEVGLLYALQSRLQVGETALVVGEVDDREVVDFAEVRRGDDDEVGGLHRRDDRRLFRQE